MKSISIGVAILLVAMLTGCSAHLGNFSGLATGTYNANNIKSENLVKKDAKGTDCIFTFFGVPFGVLKIDAAVSQALSENNGDFLMNARLYHKVKLFQLCYEIQGDAYRTNK